MPRDGAQGDVTKHGDQRRPGLDGPTLSVTRRRAGGMLSTLVVPLPILGAIGSSPAIARADEPNAISASGDGTGGVHAQPPSSLAGERSQPRVIARHASGDIENLPPLSEFLASLRPEHPRLILTPARATALRALVATDSTARSQFARLAQVGQRLLDIPVGSRTSAAARPVPGIRRMIDRITCLALLHVIDGDTRWSTRAIEEMRALADASDWNPSYFLDVAETSGAMALGYDWLYGSIDISTRDAIRAAIVEKGLRAMDAAFRQQSTWVTAGNDWTSACNAAAIIAALAVANDEPDLAHAVASRAVSALPFAIASYATDGGWPDGPAYWDASTGALAIAGAALETAIGTDLGVCSTPGLVAGLAYRLHVTGTTGLVFNYADCVDRVDMDPAVEWLGNRAGDAWVVEEARARAGATVRPFTVAWYRPAPPPVLAPPLDRWFPDAGIVCMRSAWHDPGATFCAAKGGDNAARHAHLDLGSFVLDALGQRWAMDLGPDDYTLPEYFGRKRYAYYRTRTEGHNTLVIDGQNQDPAGRAPVVGFASIAGEARAVIDLGAAYAAAGATRAMRGIGLIDGRRRVIVQDELSLRPGTDIAWAMHTQADVQVDLAAGGRVAVLTRGNARLEAQILDPAPAWFAVEVVAAPAPQRRIDGVRKLTVQMPPTSGDVRITVVFTPDVSENAPKAMPPVIPLDAWVVPTLPDD